MARTLFEKLWSRHVVNEQPDRPALLYIDLHLVHEVTSAQAFEGLRLAGRRVRRTDLTFATVDHSVPTWGDDKPIQDQIARTQIETLSRNCQEFGVQIFGLGDPNRGIVHVIGPELGLTLPGKTVVCGDSHTSTHGAFGCLAFGIGTSEIEHVLATQCLQQYRPRTLEIRLKGSLPPRIAAKDVILYIIRKIGTDGANGHVIEYRGQAIEEMTMEERMTICNMSIEAGGRAGMIAPDDHTFSYLEGRPYAPRGRDFLEAVDFWKSLSTDPGAAFDDSVGLDVSGLAPQVSWGTNPAMVTDVTGRVPDPAAESNPERQAAIRRALAYMDLRPGTAIQDLPIDRVFIGSCTNSRIEDLRHAARILEGRQVHSRVRAMAVPGSQKIKKQAEAEGVDRIFINAGFEWRGSGCSMCIGMNPDMLQPEERCASTSNRNFEGRQGRGGRTHLVSPEMAAAAAVVGHFVDIREWN